MSVSFFVDPATNSPDPEKRRAYGLSIRPPWKDGGFLFVNLPEHLEYMPDTMGIARHSDARDNVWKVSADGRSAGYEVESLTVPGVFFKVSAQATNERAQFEVTISNRSQLVLASIRPLYCFQYWGLAGFPKRSSDNFAHTYVVIGGKPVQVESIAVKMPEVHPRMAQVDGCPDRHNWWAEQAGGMIEAPLDMAFTELTASTGDRKVVLFWTPGKNLLANKAIPCIHADPYVGTLKPGDSHTARGELVFTEGPVEPLVKEMAARAERPWAKR